VSLVYATSTDLVDGSWLASAPANADRLLASASRMIRVATITSRYQVDATGGPLDATLITAFRDAACAQVAAWVTAGIDPAVTAAAGTHRVVASKGLGSGNVAYADGEQLAAAQERLRTGLCEEATAILTDTGIISPVPVTSR